MVDQSKEISLKVLIFESLQAQSNFVKFLREIALRYGHLLSADEAIRGERLMQHASETIDKLDRVLNNAVITLSDGNIHPKPSDEDSPTPGRGLCQVLEWYFPL